MNVIRDEQLNRLQSAGARFGIDAQLTTFPHHGQDELRSPPVARPTVRDRSRSRLFWDLLLLLELYGSGPRSRRDHFSGERDSHRPRLRDHRRALAAGVDSTDHSHLPGFRQFFGTNAKIGPSGLLAHRGARSCRASRTASSSERRGRVWHAARQDHPNHYAGRIASGFRVSPRSARRSTGGAALIRGASRLCWRIIHSPLQYSDHQAGRSGLLRGGVRHRLAGVRHASRAKRRNYRQPCNMPNGCFCYGSSPRRIPENGAPPDRRHWRLPPARRANCVWPTTASARPPRRQRARSRDRCSRRHLICKPEPPHFGPSPSTRLV
jgi:hypothetical protein